MDGLLLSHTVGKSRLGGSKQFTDTQSAFPDKCDSVYGVIHNHENPSNKREVGFVVWKLGLWDGLFKWEDCGMTVMGSRRKPKSNTMKNGLIYIHWILILMRKE